jgi:hypothetical protein
LGLIGIPGFFPTVTGDHHLPVLQTDASVLAGSQVGITAVAGKADERSRQGESVALGHPASATDVPAGALVTTRRSCSACLGFQPVYPLARYLVFGHVWTFAGG